MIEWAYYDEFGNKSSSYTILDKSVPIFKAAKNFAQGRLQAKHLGHCGDAGRPHHRDSKSHPPYVGPYTVASESSPHEYRWQNIGACGAR